MGSRSCWRSARRGVAAKPPACLGCPLYGDGRGFVPDELREGEGAAVFIVGQNPDADEEAQGKPFVGKTMEKYLRDAGLTRDDVSVGHALRCRWRGTNDLPPINQTLAKDVLRHCWQAHGRIPEGTRLIVAQGDYAAVTLTGGTVTDGDKSTGWRGYLRPYVASSHDGFNESWVPGPRDLPVLLTVHLARLFREPWYTLPTRLDWAKIPRILSGKWPRKPPKFNLTPPEVWPSAFAFDTEFWHEEGSAPTSARLIRWSASWGTGDGETCVVEAGTGQPRTVDGRRPRVMTQYAPADVHHLARLTGTTWKTLATEQRETVQSVLDQQGNGGVPRPVDSQAKGSVWDQFLIEDTVWKHAVLWSDHPHDLNYLGSLYSSFNRWKHLSDRDPILYSALDAIGLLEVDRALERELQADMASRRVWDTIDRPALGEFVTAQYRGLRVNLERVREVVTQLSTQANEAALRAQAICGWPINLGSNPQVGHRLYAIEGLRPKRRL
jgi:uracil-DNA glycosylase family 4